MTRNLHSDQFSLGLLLLVLILFVSGCNNITPAEASALVTGGDTQRGAAIIAAYNCGACHVIPGIPQAIGLLGPPLNWFGRRKFIAGEIPNEPSNLAQWIASPTSLKPKTAMPSVGLSEKQSRDVAAYLYTLR